jgi:hypothetical protein
MKRVALAIVIILGGFVMTHQQAHAVACAKGVYRAGCVGPNGAAAVRKPVYRAPTAAVRGPNGAAVRGPNGGAAVVRRPY